MPAPSRRLDLVASIGLLGFLALLAYGPWATRLGFFRDDWYVLWAGRAYGPSAILELFSIDRPAVGWLFSQTYALFRESAIAWHVYALALRLLGAIFALGLFRTLWPSRPAATTMAAILFLIYPGFLQQPNAVTFTNQLTTYLLAVVSLALTAWAVTTRRRDAMIGLTLLALAASLAYQLLYEYMIGLEAARLAVLGLVAWRDQASSRRQRASWMFRHWLPYAGVTLLNLMWRGLWFESQRSATDLPGLVQTYAASPLRMFFTRSVELIKDVGEVLVAGWVIPTYELADTGKFRPVAVALLVSAAGVVGSLLAFRLIRAKDTASEEGPRSLSNEMVLFGLVALIGGLIPVVFASRDVRWESSFDRYALHVTLGMGLVTVGLGLRLRDRSLRRAMSLALVAVGLFTHYLNGSIWAAFWEAQRQLWWQLSWRAPQFDQGTVLLAQLPIDGFYEDYEVWGPANLIYQPAGPIRITSEVFTEGTAEKVFLGLRNQREMRDIVAFSRDFNQVVVAARPTVASCVHLLDGGRSEIPNDASGLVRDLAPFSDIRLVDPNATPPSVPALFGAEPDHGWCYYYQQASLARQKGDWTRAADLAHEVLELGLEPSDLSEWFPFLEALGAVGDEPAARRVSSFLQDNDATFQVPEYLRQSDGPRDGMCREVIEHPFPESSRAELVEFVESLCAQY